MDRRKFLTALLASPLLTAARGADALGACDPTGTQCRVSVDLREFHFAQQSQQQSQWCWAACISMLFAHQRRPVQQHRIVSAVYGGPVNMPSLDGMTIARSLNRPWVDDTGRPFQAQLGAVYDAYAGVNAISDRQVIDHLRRGVPLVLGARGHAVILTSVDYIRTPMGPRVIAATAFDPWPGRGHRRLSPDEITPPWNGGSMMFLAMAHIR